MAAPSTNAPVSPLRQRMQHDMPCEARDRMIHRMTRRHNDLPQLSVG